MSNLEITENLKQLLNFRHSNPHSFLGIHPTDNKEWVINIWKPDVIQVNISINKKKFKAVNQFMPGFFVAKIPYRVLDKFNPYVVEVVYANQNSYKYIDPYCFWPTLGDLDIHLLGEGQHHEMYKKLGSHVMIWQGIEGVSFSVWAPNAQSISVVGDFNYWDGRQHMMRMLGSGIWEIFIPQIKENEKYKFEIHDQNYQKHLKTDPIAFYAEQPPKTASIIFKSGYQFKNTKIGQNGTKKSSNLQKPISIYEVHLESWRKVPDEQNRSLTYKELAAQLPDYVEKMGFTHVEFLPVMEHPYGGSWGYQISSYFAPTSRFGNPDDFKFLVDSFHERNIGVILDWAPAHFPKDEFSLGRFDGTSLYEHQDPRQGEHPDWGTYIFNFGRNEVRNFLISNALYWILNFQVDGLRIDAVASMLYLDYSRKDGEWIPNENGGRENLSAIQFLKQLNELVYSTSPEPLMIAEESTDWNGVSRPTYLGGLGFGFKWNMGWMHDTLNYFSKDPVFRKYHHQDLTFGFLYAWNENFILPLSHDEVVHGKKSLIEKMPGDHWQKFSNLRALYGYMWAYPGKKHLFMGNEWGQWREWNHSQSLDWHLLDAGDHRGIQYLISELNRLYKTYPALYTNDCDSEGFKWIEVDQFNENIIVFKRISTMAISEIICVGNFSGNYRENYRIGVSKLGYYSEILNTDSRWFGGTNIGNWGGVRAQTLPYKGFPFSIEVNLPPLSTLWFETPK
jgi:1,4-alpha-glucan branching enzyme